MVLGLVPNCQTRYIDIIMNLSRFIRLFECDVMFDSCQSVVLAVLELIVNLLSITIMDVSPAYTISPKSIRLAEYFTDIGEIWQK